MYGSRFDFSEKAEQALRYAQECAAHMGHGILGTEHLLYGLSAVKDSMASKILAAKDITAEKILEALKAHYEDRPFSSETRMVEMTPRTKSVLQLSVREAAKLGNK